MFSRKSNVDKQTPIAASFLAAYFDLSEAVTESWLSPEKSTLTVTFPFAAQAHWPDLQDGLIEATELKPDQVLFKQRIQAAPTKLPNLAGIKNVVAVASGKGGVGKSATSVNLAFALQAQGARVGILDADIYGPSVPIMLGNPEHHPKSEDQRSMQPLEAHGLVANSIGYLVPAENAAIWRGPMVTRALQQLVHDTQWPELDYLVVDMPPGTGDIQLTLAQQVPVSGAVVVTTPQDLALADAVKGISMFTKVEIPVIGIIENMSFHRCSNCGHEEPIFAHGGGQRLTQKYKTELLAQLPLDIRIREHADQGKPLMLAEDMGEIQQQYLQAALMISRHLAL